MSFKFPLYMAVLFAFSGCFWNTHLKPQEKPFNVVFNCADAGLLKAGGKIAFAPFKAGSQASADDQLDRVSLTIIKGITDRLAQSKTSLAVATPQEEPDLVFGGYVDELAQNSRYQRLILRRGKGRLVIFGQIRLSSTGVKAADFAAYARLDAYKDATEAAYELGLFLGNEIALQAAVIGPARPVQGDI